MSAVGHAAGKRYATTARAHPAWRRLPALVLIAALAAGGTGRAFASCLPETDAVASPADRLVDTDPARAEALARSELARHDRTYPPSTLARLNLVAAAVESGEGRSGEALATLTHAVEQINLLTGPQRTLGLQIRLLEVNAAAATERADFERIAGEARRMAAGAAQDSRERACLLLVSGDAQTELDRPDFAVTDLFTAYQSAEHHGWSDTQLQAALRLATTYRRGGLVEDAEHMADTATSLALRGGYRRLLWVAYFTSGQIAVDERRWDAALDVLRKGRELAIDLGDRLDAAFTTLPMCAALIGAGRLDDAQLQCRAGDATFDALGRIDLATDALMYRSRIMLVRQQFDRALEGFDTILGARLEYEPVRYLAGLYRDRATALVGIGRYREAAADFQRSIASAAQADLAEHARRLAVLTGRSRARALEATNLAFQHENQRQREQLLTQSARRRLSLALAAAAAFACAVLAAFLIIERRHRRALARGSAVLRTLTDNLPDTVMLLDRTGRLQFANRALPGRDAAATGTQVADVVPAQVRPLWNDFIEEVLRSGATRMLQLGWDDARGSPRWTENCAAPVVADGSLLGIALRSSDVTARQALEGRLQLQASVLDAMSDGVLVIDDEGCPLFANSRMYDLLGMQADERAARGLAALGPAAARLQRAAADSADRSAAYVEAALRAADGADRLAGVAISRLTLTGRRVLICVCHDISVQRRTERALASATRLEALAISARLHEDLAQDLTGIALLAKRAAEPAARDISTHLSRVIGTARELAALLSPTTVVSGSINIALGSLAREEQRRIGVPILCTTPAAELEIDDLVADQLYTIAKSALEFADRQNVCASMHMALTGDGDHLKLRVGWDGAPRDARQEGQTSHDLEAMSYRSRLLGGSLDRTAAEQPAGSILVTLPMRVTES